MWPTPTARDHKDTGANTDYQKIAAKSRLAGVVMVREKWPTPRAQDAKHGAATEWEMQTDHAGTKDPLRVHVAKKGDTGQLNPTWVEWLMGFPPHWTLVG
jgi:DNA (cytosine-5)-methyltransferase 1